MAIKPKWVFDIEIDYKEVLIRTTSLPFSKGFSQRGVQDYFAVLATVSRYSTFRLLGLLSVQNRWIPTGLDVKIAFLNAKLDGKVHVAQPSEFIIKGF